MPSQRGDGRRRSRWARACLRRAFGQRGYCSGDLGCRGSGRGHEARARRKKGEGASGGASVSLKDLGKMHGQPPDTMISKVTVRAEVSGRAVSSGVSGGGQKPTKTP